MDAGRAVGRDAAVVQRVDAAVAPADGSVPVRRPKAWAAWDA